MASAEHSLRYIQANSPMHRLYPLVKLAWVLVIAFGLFLFRSPLSGAILFGIVLLTAVFYARIPLKAILDSSLVIFGIAFLLMIFHLFADPGTPVYRFGPLTITTGGLHEGPIFFFRLSVIVLSSFLLIWTTDGRDLMISIAKAGVPYRYAFAVFLALRFLPLVQREVDAVQAAHTIRGRSTRSGLAHRFKLWQRYMFTVLINGLRKAEATATALECRAFGCYPDRTYVKEVFFRPIGVLFPAAFFLLIAALITLERLA